MTAVLLTNTVGVIALVKDSSIVTLSQQATIVVENILPKFLVLK